MDYNNLFVQELDRIHNANTYKYETAFSTPQAGVVKVNGKNVVTPTINSQSPV